MPSAFDPDPIPPASDRPLTIAELALEIDKRYDAMLVDGISMQELLWIEGQRQNDHQQLVSGLSAGNFRRI